MKLGNEARNRLGMRPTITHVVLLLEMSLFPSFILSVRGRDPEELLSPSLALSPFSPPPTSSLDLDLCFLWWVFLCFFFGLPCSLLVAEEQIWRHTNHKKTTEALCSLGLTGQTLPSTPSLHLISFVPSTLPSLSRFFPILTSTQHSCSVHSL